MCFQVSVSNLDTPTGMHIHKGAEGAAGHGAIALRVHAYGARGDRRAIDAVVTGVPESPRVTSWMERR